MRMEEEAWMAHAKAARDKAIVEFVEFAGFE
jgi:hypothetical protein